MDMEGRLSWLVLLAVALLACPASCRRLSRCELVRELRELGFQEWDLPNWVCLVEHDSSSDTGKISDQSEGDHHSYGLFQITDLHYCEHGKPGGQCEVKCEDLITDDITIAAHCAKKIFAISWFWGWYGWARYCLESSLPDIKKC